jgi:hypothetical protein
MQGGINEADKSYGPEDSMNVCETAIRRASWQSVKWSRLQQAGGMFSFSFRDQCSQMSRSVSPILV